MKSLHNASTREIEAQLRSVRDEKDVLEHSNFELSYGVSRVIGGRKVVIHILHILYFSFHIPFIRLIPSFHSFLSSHMFLCILSHSSHLPTAPYSHKL